MERRPWGLLLLGLVLALLAVPDARAAECGYDAASGRLTVVGGERTEIRRGGSGNLPTDPIVVDGTACGAATVATADTIAVTGQGVTVNLANGALAPGRTLELGLGLFSGEIEITGTATSLTVVGSAAADQLTHGSGGVNLNAGEALEQDADVNLAGARVTLAGSGGADTLSGAGDTVLQGGAGNDSLRAAGPGDVADFSDAPGAVRLDLGIEQAVADGHGGTDVLDNVRTVVGGPRGDTLGGTQQADTIVGGPGVDAIAAAGGPDRVLVRDGEQDAVDCGAGTDSVVADDATIDSFLGGCEVIERPVVQTPPAGAPTPTPTPGIGVGTAIPGVPLPDTPLTPSPTATPRPGATRAPTGPRGRLKVTARLQRTGLRRLVRRGLRVRVQCSRACELLALLRLSRKERKRTGLSRTIAFIGGEAPAATPVSVHVVLADKTRVRRLRKLTATLVLRISGGGRADVVRRLRVVARR